MPYPQRGKIEVPPPVSKPHSLSLTDRKKLAVSGVEEVESFDEAEIVMRTAGGTLVVGGEDLSVSRLSVETGDVSVEGLVTELRYETASAPRGLWARLRR